MAKNGIFIAATGMALFLLVVLSGETNQNLFSRASAESLADVPNVQTMALLEAPLNPNGAQGGGDIIIVDDSALLPEDGPNGISSDTVRTASSDQISVYVVREGDSLSQVAEMFNVNVNTIVWANDLKNSKDIHDGQTLVILPVSGVRHTVAKGDTLKSIATKYSGDIDEIALYNNLSENSTLAVGEVIVVPDGEIAAPKGSSATYTTTGSGGAVVATDGYFTHPIVGGVRTQGIHGYNAIDVGASAGTPFYAAAAGTVIISRSGGWNGGYGNYLVVKHPNGTQTLYAHNAVNYVGVGDVVSQGQAIGTVGNTGKATGYHLHFEVRGAKNPF